MRTRSEKKLKDVFNAIKFINILANIRVYRRVKCNLDHYLARARIFFPWTIYFEATTKGSNS